MTITLTDVDPLLSPPPELRENYGSELRWSAGPLIGGVDWLCEELLGYSPLTELTKPLFGDWGRFESASTAWAQVGQAVAAVGVNYRAMAEARATFWVGEAAEAYSARLVSTAENFSDYEEGCAAMVETSVALKNLTTTGVELLYGILGWLGDWATRIAIEAAIPIVGWAAGVIDGAINTVVALDKGRKAFAAIQRIVNFIERFTDLIEILIKVANAIKAAMTAAEAISDIRAVNASSQATANAFGTA